MVSAIDFGLAKAVEYARARGAKVAQELVVNFILPFLIYSCVSGRLGAAPALIAASAPPILWSIVAFVRQRKVDAISIVALCGIALSLIAFAGGGGLKFLQLRENLVTGLIGLIFLSSVAIGRPLIYQLTRAGVRRKAADKVQVVEALRGDVQFRRSMTIATLGWGFGLLAACAVNCALIFLISIRAYLLIGGPLNCAAIGLMTALTYWYVPRSIRRAAARLAASGPTSKPA